MSETWTIVIKEISPRREDGSADGLFFHNAQAFRVHLVSDLADAVERALAECGFHHTISADEATPL